MDRLGGIPKTYASAFLARNVARLLQKYAEQMSELRGVFHRRDQQNAVPQGARKDRRVGTAVVVGHGKRVNAAPLRCRDRLRKRQTAVG